MRFQDTHGWGWLAQRTADNIGAAEMPPPTQASTIVTTSRIRLISIPMLLLIAACTTWSQPKPPETALAHVDQQPIQVARADHSTIVLKNASVQGDSLIGVADDGSNARVAIPVSEIQGVSQRDVDAPRTLALTGGIILSALGVLFIAALVALSQANWD